jgi:hypothetical protein
VGSTHALEGLELAADAGCVLVASGGAVQVGVGGADGGALHSASLALGCRERRLLEPAQALLDAPLGDVVAVALGVALVSQLELLGVLGNGEVGELVEL